jgi:glucose-6-phosphate isomerase/transaldolase/glucose-6-phosphate isomerase
MDIERLLANAAAVAESEFADPPGRPGGALLGALLGDYAAQGRDKLTFLFSPAVAPFGDWIEQLIAESTGKEGEGILPVVGEALAAPALYGDDRLFIALRLGEDTAGEAELRALAEAGQPVVDLRIDDPYDLGGQCFFWEVATALAGWRLALNPFDQPDVEAAKVIARRMIAEYRERGALPAEAPILCTAGVSVYGAVEASDPAGAIRAFLGRPTRGAYIALQAYLHPTSETDAALERLRTILRQRLRLPVTVGYGPRFLHSTGQLHKGDAGRGLFLQLTADAARDAPIPDEPGRSESSLSFGTLKAAQARGDRLALLAVGRPVLRLHFDDHPAAGIVRLAASL